MIHRGLVQEVSQEEIWKDPEQAGHSYGSKWCVGLGDGRGLLRAVLLSNSVPMQVLKGARVGG